MKRIHINESQLLELNIYGSNSFVAGTDHPYFVDPHTEETYAADWNGDYGFPFGFWGNQEFSVGDAWSTHENACGKVAERYFASCLEETVDNDVTAIMDRVDDLISDYGTEIDEEILYEAADDLTYDMQFMTDYEGVFEIMSDAIHNGGNINPSKLANEIIERAINAQDFTTRKGIDAALELIGESFDSFFEDGYGEGRIWPQKEMIGFYETEQPDPQNLLYILQLLSQNDEIGVSYESMLNYHMVFEDWRNDGEITCCTVSDYVDGNYGPEDYEEDEDKPIQYNNGQKTVFVPHLANQQDKWEFFKNFRDTRDRAMYVPRERGGNGTLAQYHAMRYPYGENKKNKKKVIK